MSFDPDTIIVAVSRPKSVGTKTVIYTNLSKAITDVHSTSSSIVLKSDNMQLQ